MGWTTTINGPDVWFGFVTRTTTAGAQFGGISNYLISDAADGLSGIVGAATNATVQAALGLGFFTATTAGMPASIPFSQINGSNSAAFRPAIYRFLSQSA